MQASGHEGFRERLATFAGPLLGACVFGVAVLVLRHELAEYHL